MKNEVNNNIENYVTDFVYQNKIKLPIINFLRHINRFSFKKILAYIFLIIGISDFAWVVYFHITRSMGYYDNCASNDIGALFMLSLLSIIFYIPLFLSLFFICYPKSND